MIEFTRKNTKSQLQFLFLFSLWAKVWVCLNCWYFLKQLQRPTNKLRTNTSEKLQSTVGNGKVEERLQLDLAEDPPQPAYVNKLPVCSARPKLSRVNIFWREITSRGILSMEIVFWLTKIWAPDNIERALNCHIFHNFLHTKTAAASRPFCWLRWIASWIILSPSYVSLIASISYSHWNTLTNVLISHCFINLYVIMPLSKIGLEKRGNKRP